MTQLNLMTEGSPRRRILRFALPILGGYFFQQLYNTVDALIVGNFLDADALAAVTSTSSYMYLLIGFVTGFSTGAGIIIARHIGAGNAENTRKAVHLVNLSTFNPVKRQPSRCSPFSGSKIFHRMEPPLTLAEKEKEPQHIVVPNFNRHNIFYCEDFIALFFR